ncbi:hypothetical protein ACLOJK_035758, partial [Asimina triloba]
MAATAASAGHLHLSPLPPPEEPTVASTTPPSSVADDGRLPLAADVAEEAKASPSTTVQTHRRQALHRTIRAIHHNGNDEHIPDPSRPQADVDHSGHTKASLPRPPFIMLGTVPIIYQHAHEPARCHGHHLARAKGRHRCPRARHRLCPLPAARARCRLIATIRLLPAPSNNGLNQAAAKLGPAGNLHFIS